MKEVPMDSAMREGMRRLASGVSVVATKTAAGDRFAMTATSVTSLCAEPPSLLVCINRDTSMFEAIQGGSDFSMNILLADQQDVSNKCASKDKGEARFEVGDWQEHEGTPFLNNGLVTFFCEQDKFIDYGSHRIVIGKITRVLVDESDEVDPLVFLNGGYHKI
jgi:flavin reductase (NADH)